MKVSDYIVAFLIEKGITDVFGYPGGMVTHLLDSFRKYGQRIAAHVNYHEQASALAACGYAQATLKPGVAYATSGPGATNLLTGICNAYFDSIPVIFITGQVNTYEAKGDLPLRQKGFQEMDVTALVSSCVKYCHRITQAEEIRLHLEKAFYYAANGRPGPCLLDIPMNIQRAEVEPERLAGFSPPPQESYLPAETACRQIYEALQSARRPCILAGAGIDSAGVREAFAAWIKRLDIPVVSSMPAIDLLPASPRYYGFVGAYGLRQANFILSKCDLLLALGSRLDLHQTGADLSSFAVKARLVRVDIDRNEFARRIKPAEEDLLIDLRTLLPALLKHGEKLPDRGTWLAVCEQIRSALQGRDESEPNRMIKALSLLIEPDCIITTDVGQNQVWTAQSFVTRGQRVLFSGGHGTMGYALPAAIGACLGTGRKTIAFTGDGGLQMNIQELQTLKRDRPPVKIILLNNRALGMIRHFQEMYFERAYMHTIKELGYSTPDFAAVSAAYGIDYFRINQLDDVESAAAYLAAEGPALIEARLSERTYVYPKLAVGKALQNQEPPLERELYDFLNSL